MKPALLIISFLLNLLWIKALAGNDNFSRFKIGIKKSPSEIKIDGILDETAWQTAETAKDFYQKFPADTCFSKTRTEVKLTYDENFIYIAAICYDTIAGDNIITSLKRDWSFPISDGFAVFIDPFNDKTNGFSFGVNPMGAQREGMIDFAGTMGVTTDWDNKWYSSVKRYAGKWIVEMAIPFKTIRFKPGLNNWGINFGRNDLKANEQSSWAPVPQIFNISTLGYTGRLEWDEPPKNAGTNISVIPYVTVGGNRDYQNASETKPKSMYNGGLDAKIAVTSSLNLDLTINPDFSQVEVDRQVTNLTRFSLFFPEKRTFFLENSDLFARFGFRQIRPFFSRKIGLQDGVIVPIIAGARLSGRINEKWRIGVMNMQTAKSAAAKTDAQNYTVIAAQRQVFEKSNIAAIFVNRQGTSDTAFEKHDFNRIAGLDYNLVSKNNKWQGKAFCHYAILNHKANDNFAQAVWLNRFTRRLTLEWNHEYVGQNYISDVGFTPRLYNYNSEKGKTERIAYWRFEPFIFLKFYPNSKIINNHGPQFYLSQYTDKKFTTNDLQYKTKYFVAFQNQSELGIDYSIFFTKLYFNTDITRSGQMPISKGNYSYNNFHAEYNSSKIPRFYYFVTADYGKFYIGEKTSYSADLNYRIQPYAIVSLTYSRDEIKMPSPYKNVTFDLISPRVEISFSKSLFLTTFVQYNKQLNNMNINSRMQWRFRPMSDLYIVYSDNYDAINLNKKNRALVVKFVYWFSL